MLRKTLFYPCVVASSLVLSACGGGGGGGGGDTNSNPSVDQLSLSVVVTGTQHDILIVDETNNKQTYVNADNKLAFDDYELGDEYSLVSGEPVGMECSFNRPTGTIDTDLSVTLNCIEADTSSVIGLDSFYTKNGSLILDLEPGTFSSYERSSTVFQVMGRKKGTSDFNLIQESIAGQNGSIEVDGLEEGVDYELYVVEAGNSPSKPYIIDASVTPPDEFMDGVVPTYMSEYADNYVITTYYDSFGQLFVKFTPKDIDAMSDDWGEVIQSNLLDTYLHADLDGSTIQVAHLESVYVANTPVSQRFFGKIKEMVFKATEKAYESIRKFAQIDVGFRYSSQATNRVATRSLSNLKCKTADNNYIAQVPFDPYFNWPKTDYDLNGRIKLFIRDGQYLPNDAYINLRGFVSSSMSFGLKIVYKTNNHPTYECKFDFFDMGIPFPYIPAWKLGDVALSIGTKVEAAKLEAEGNFQFNSDFTYVIDSTSGYKNGEPIASVSAKSFDINLNPVADTKGKLEAETGIFLSNTLKIAPGMRTSTPAAWQLANMELKLGYKVGASIESELLGLVNGTSLFSMEELKAIKGPLAEIEIKSPSFPILKPWKKENEYLKSLQKDFDLGLPKYKDLNLGTLVPGQEIDIELTLEKGEDDSDVDVNNIIWSSVPEGSFTFSASEGSPLKTTARANVIVIDDDRIAMQPQRNIVIHLPHKSGFDFLSKNIVANVEVVARCPNETEFFLDIGQESLDNHRVEFEFEELSVGNCTIKLMKQNPDGTEWLEASATYESGILVHHDRFHDNQGTLALEEELEPVVLNSGAVVSTKVSTVTQSSDKETKEVKQYTAVLNKDGNSVSSIKSGKHTKETVDETYEVYYEVVERPETVSGYDSIRTGDEITTANDNTYVTNTVATYSPLICADGFKVEYKSSEVITYPNYPDSSITRTFGHYPCEDHRKLEHVFYPIEETTAFPNFGLKPHTIKTTYLPLFGENEIHDLTFSGKAYFQNSSERITFNEDGSLASKHYQGYTTTLKQASEIDLSVFETVAITEDNTYLAYMNLQKDYYFAHYWLGDDSQPNQVTETVYEQGVVDDWQSTFTKIGVSKFSEFPALSSRYEGWPVTYYTEFYGDVVRVKQESHEYLHYSDDTTYVEYQEEPFVYDHDVPVRKPSQLHMTYSSLLEVEQQPDGFDTATSHAHGTKKVYRELGSQEVCNSEPYMRGKLHGVSVRKENCHGSSAYESISWNDGVKHGPYQYGTPQSAYMEKGSYSHGVQKGEWNTYEYGVLTDTTYY